MKHRKAVFMARSFLKRLCLRNGVKHWLKWKDDLNYKYRDEMPLKKRHFRSIYMRNIRKTFGKYPPMLFQYHIRRKIYFPIVERFKDEID